MCNNTLPFKFIPLFFAPYIIQEWIILHEYNGDDRGELPEVNEKGEYIINSVFLNQHNLLAENIPLTIQQQDFFANELPESYKMDTWLDVEHYLLAAPTDGYTMLFNYLKRAYDTPYLAICAIPPCTNVNLSDNYEYAILPFFKNKESEYLSTPQGCLFSLPPSPTEPPIHEDNRQFRYKFKLYIKQAEYQAGVAIDAKERGVCKKGDNCEDINCFML